MEDREKYLQLKSVIIHIVVFLITLVTVVVSSFLYTNRMEQIIRNSVICVVCLGTIIFLLCQARINHSYQEDNEEHPLRFAICFLIGVILAVLLPILPITGWPYVAVFIILTLFSNVLLGIVSSTFLLLLSVLLSTSADVNTFCLYFVSGIICSILFQKLDDDFKIGYPMMITVMVIILCEMANSVLFVNETLHWELLIIPAVNVIVSAILILIILKLYGQLVVFKFRERFQIINDSECPLMVELKEKQPDLYIHTVHVAYLSDRIATALNLDTQCVKTMSYYYKIGILAGEPGETTYENAVTMIEDYEFPSVTYSYLKDVIENPLYPNTKEAFVVLIADMMISSVEFLYAKNPNKEIQYEQVIHTLLKKKIESAFPNKCGITYGEMDTVKQILLEEKLYYDFLHR